MSIAQRAVGALALVLGALGSIAAAVGAFAVLWFGATASGFVTDITDRILVPVERLDTRIEETVSAVENVDRAGELEARAQGLADTATAARESLSAFDDHPLLGRLPVDTTVIATRLDEIEGTAVDARRDLAATDPDEQVPAAVRGEVVDRLDGARSELAAAGDAIDDVGGRLAWWVRIVALVSALVCAWGLWGQLLLARYGWTVWRRVGAEERRRTNEVTAANATV